MLDRAIEIQPDFAPAYYNRGIELAGEGKMKEAISYTQKAVELKPNLPMSHNELAKLLASQCRWREAIGHLEIALELDPNAIVVQENLAWVLATTAPNEGGDPKRAVALAEHVCRVIPSPDDDDWNVLAAAYAADGRFADALAVADRALSIAVTRGKDDVAAEIRAHIKLYEAKMPYRK